jgi:hypothetical protein
MDSFLGDNCEMLDALAHLSMRVLRRNEGLSNAPAAEGAEALRVTFDCAGFRDKKAQELRELASAQRDKVIESGGKPAYIRALGPSERKIIHTALADLGEVTSESIGRGNFKRIRVKLKDDSQFRREPEARQPRMDGEGGGGQQRSANGGGGGGRGRRGGRGGRGRGPGQGGGNYNNGGEVNGNVARDERNYEVDAPDDNIGNRLRPGEEPAFRYTPPSVSHNGDPAGNN